MQHEVSVTAEAKTVIDLEQELQDARFEISNLRAVVAEERGRRIQMEHMLDDYLRRNKYQIQAAAQQAQLAQYQQMAANGQMNAMNAYQYSPANEQVNDIRQGHYGHCTCVPARSDAIAPRRWGGLFDR